MLFAVFYHNLGLCVGAFRKEISNSRVKAKGQRLHQDLSMYSRKLTNCVPVRGGLYSLSQCRAWLTDLDL